MKLKLEKLFVIQVLVKAIVKNIISKRISSIPFIYILKPFLQIFFHIKIESLCSKIQGYIFIKYRMGIMFQNQADPVWKYSIPVLAP